MEESHYAVRDPAIIGSILCRLDSPTDLAAASCVCRAWCKECLFDGNWKPAYLRVFGNEPDVPERRER